MILFGKTFQVASCWMCQRLPWRMMHSKFPGPRKNGRNSWPCASSFSSSSGNVLRDVRCGDHHLCRGDTVVRHEGAPSRDNENDPSSDVLLVELMPRLSRHLRYCCVSGSLLITCQIGVSNPVSFLYPSSLFFSLGPLSAKNPLRSCCGPGVKRRS